MQTKHIDLELSRASIQFIKENERYVNNKAIEKIYNRGYIKKARVVQVTKIANTAQVIIRADGAKIEFEIDAKDLDRVYSNAKAYAEKYI
ncbi:hypothetical protein [Pseudomonas sp.]|uniref:hypothetical protein n=1 Tax=Pseudomonas sp. TaxID=306 RepID=UPI00261C5C0A|nr:hypothetical protein [Pseudomonas sp.]